MSKIRADYENTAWRKFERFVNGEPSLRQNESEKLEAEMEIASTEDRERNKKIEEVLVDAEDIKSERHRREIAALYHKYQNWPETKGLKIFERTYRVLAVVFCMAIIAVLLYTVTFLPEFGNPNNPANSNEVVTTYLEEGMEATGAVNIVTGVILDYRAFDTLGESHVLFIAACCVLILLRIDKDKSGKVAKAWKDAEENDRKYEPKNDKILQGITLLLVPVIIIYGIYVILNGHLSPGGGFSGGAIIGAGLILYLNAFGFKKTEKFFTYKTFSAVSFGSLIFYACAKSYSFFTGANHLNSHIPLGTPGDILSAGLILPLNIAVGLVVACTMYSFYALFRKGGM